MGPRRRRVVTEVASWTLDREVVVACRRWRRIGKSPRVTVGRGGGTKDWAKGHDSRGSGRADLTVARDIFCHQNRPHRPPKCRKPILTFLSSIQFLAEANLSAFSVRVRYLHILRAVAYRDTIVITCN
jgi:hypothetical protein